MEFEWVKNFNYDAIDIGAFDDDTVHFSRMVDSKRSAYSKMRKRAREYKKKNGCMPPWAKGAFRVPENPYILAWEAFEYECRA